MAVTGGEPGPEIRFANSEDGWVLEGTLWETHDGGEHWYQPTLAGLHPGYEVTDVEASSGYVQVAVIDGSLDLAVRIESSPVSSDAWVESPTSVQIGAGPVPFARIVLQDTTGWLIENDRTIIGGARLVDGTWVPWDPPCTSVGGEAALAASDAQKVVADCLSGVWTNPPVISRTYVSDDGGSTFHSTPTPIPNAVFW